MARHMEYQPPKVGSVLIADDEELEKRKFDVSRASNYEEAMDIMRNKDIHALVTDVFLSPPKSDGLDLVAEAKNFGISSIIITSALDVDVAKEGLNKGGDFLIEKPVNPDELAKVLVQIWENPKGLIARRERYLVLHELTDKEKELCRLILKGLTNQEIADISGTTVGTVKFYSSQIFQKFGVKNRAELFNLIFPT